MAERLTGFLAMPFGDELVNNVATDLKAAAEKHSIRLVSVDREPGSPLTQTVIKNIVTKIHDSQLCVAILKGSNPNVALEVGYALGSLCPLMLVSSADEQVEVDIDAMVRTTYPTALKSSERVGRFEEAFEKFRAALESNDFLATNHSMRRILESMRSALVADFLSKHHLYRKCVLYVLDEFADAAQGWKAELKFDGREQVLDIGRHNLHHVERSGFATFYFPGEESWRANDHAHQDEQYLHLSREQVRQRDIDMTRVYVLSSTADLSSPDLRKFVLDDASAGIKSLYILESDLEAIDKPVAKDFGIWDDEMVGVVEYVRRRDMNEIAGTTHKYLSAALSQARRWRRELEKASKPCTGLPPEVDLLHQTYTVQEDLANTTHDEGWVDEHDAAWYYASRQYLRISNVVAAPDWHDDFFREGFKTWHADRGTEVSQPSILICGLADYGMLYQMIAAVGPILAPKCKFVVLDRSSVPLEMAENLVQMLADGGSATSDDDHAGMDVRMETRRADIRDSSKLAGSQFDVIVTDALLTRFESVDEKKAVIARWHELLNPGGIVLTTARTKHDVDGASREKLKSAREAFIDRAVDQWPADVGGNKERYRLKSYAKIYADRIKSYPFTSRDDVEDLFKHVDWQRLDCKTRQTNGELAPTVYVEVAAQKV